MDDNSPTMALVGLVLFALFVTITILVGLYQRPGSSEYSAKVNHREPCPPRGQRGCTMQTETREVAPRIRLDGASSGVKPHP